MRLGVLPYTCISVDCFTTTKAQIFFLTHFHADHYKGLKDGFTAGRIFCTELTAGLLRQKFKIDPNIIGELEYGSHTLDIVSIVERHAHYLENGVQCPHDLHKSHMSSQDSILNVEVIPANHCPGGAVMLFEGYFGKYLHTGDFRYDPTLHDRFLPRLIRPDRLFLDTTFLDPFWRFPKKTESAKQVISLIKQHADDGKHVFLECGMLGTEEILFQVHRAFGCKIHVDEDKYSKLLHIPTLSEILTTQASSTRIHACRANALASIVAPTKSNRSPSTLSLFKRQSVTKLLRETVAMATPALFIKPSTMWFGHKTTERMNQVFHQPTQVDSVWHVLFSIHSSYPELVEFVSKVMPRRIVPTVECERVFLATLSVKQCLNPTKPIIPSSIEAIMKKHTGNSLRNVEDDYDDDGSLPLMFSDHAEDIRKRKLDSVLGSSEDEPDPSNKRSKSNLDDFHDDSHDEEHLPQSSDILDDYERIMEQGVSTKMSDASKAMAVPDDECSLAFSQSQPETHSHAGVKNISDSPLSLFDDYSIDLDLSRCGQNTSLQLPNISESHIQTNVSEVAASSLPEQDNQNGPSLLELLYSSDDEHDKL